MDKADDDNARLNFAVGTNEIAIRFDDISMLEEDCYHADCYQNLIHVGTIQEGIYQADEFIQSSGEIDVNAPTVEYRANGNIQLNNGFSIPANASFRAFINECE